jgi:DNA-binding response OmpR family regulator
MDGKILIVDDKKEIRNSLGQYFNLLGFNIVLAENGIQALEKVRENKPDVVILDVQLPLLDGWEVCKQIRKESGQSIGIIMISEVRKDLPHRVVGLELGADVYTPKPFETSELEAQVRALLRRMQSQKQVAQTGWYVVDDYLRINFERRIVEAGGKDVHLTKQEFDLLKCLAEQPGVPVGRTDLIDRVWQPRYDSGKETLESAINSAVSKLRSKIELDAANPRYILSVHGIGYRFGK